MIRVIVTTRNSISLCTFSSTNPSFSSLRPKLKIQAVCYASLQNYYYLDKLHRNLF